MIERLGKAGYRLAFGLGLFCFVSMATPFVLFYISFMTVVLILRALAIGR